MLFYVFIISAFSIATFGLSIGKSTFPITTCKRNSTDFSVCLKRAIEKEWPRFIAGFPEIDFPILDPIFFEYAEAKLNLGEIRGELSISNLTAIGLSKVRFLDVRPHFLDDIFRLEIDAELSWLFVEAVVDINGTLNVFRIAGKGHFNQTMHDIRGTWDLIGHVINDTWIVEHFRVTPSVGKMKIYFDNLLEQGKEFNDLAVKFVNEYWPALYRAILPIAADTWDSWLVNLTNRFFSKVPFSEIFP